MNQNPLHRNHEPFAGYRRLLALLALLLFLPPAFGGHPIEVIELQASTLDEVIPLVRPLAGPDGTVTGMGNNLVIKAAPERVQEIRELLARIDRPPRRLMIYVSKVGDLDSSTSGYSGSADIELGDSRARINSPVRPVEDPRTGVAVRRNDDSRARLGVRQRDSFHERGTGQQVQALEGRPAWIHAGLQVPVYDGYPYGTRFEDMTSGFYVVPRVSGNEVTVEILQQDNRPGRIPGQYPVQEAGTIVRGQLGAWIELGGINTSRIHSERGPGYSRERQALGAQQIRVRVECPDCVRR